MNWKEDLYHDVKMKDDFCDIKLKFTMISSGAIVMQLYFYILKAKVYHGTYCNYSKLPWIII